MNALISFINEEVLKWTLYMIYSSEISKLLLGSRDLCPAATTAPYLAIALDQLKTFYYCIPALIMCKHARAYLSRADSPA